MGYRIEFFGWCSDEGHDKVWGWISLAHEADLFSFWGRRGGKLTWKRWTSESSLEALRDSKIRKGYRSVPIADIEAETPGFTHEFERAFMLCRMFDQFHGVR